MAEQFTNGAQTTLAAGVGAGDLTVGVADASPFPGGPRFRIRVGGELMLVTGVAPGGVWTVERGAEFTAAAAHAAGAGVTQVLTAGALEEVTTLTADQAANAVLAGPAAGGAGAPAFRALVAADLPAGAGTGTVTSVGVTPPAAGITVSGSPVTSSGSIALALADDLAAVESLSGAGLAARTGAGAWATRAVAGTANRLAVANGDGVAGDPTLDISPGYAGQATITTLGAVTAGAWNATPVAVAYGGTGAATAAAARANLGLAIGTNVQAWDAGLDSLAGLSTTGKLYYLSAADTWAPVAVGTGLSFVGGTLTSTTAGTVTSVGLSLPAMFSVSSSPVTTSGTLTATLVGQSANAVFAGPSSGGAAAPGFRALVAGDLPAFSGGDVTSSAGSGVLSIGTNKVTDALLRKGAPVSVIGNATSGTANVADIAAGSDGQVLRRTGTTLAFGAVDLTSSNAVTGALRAGSFPALSGDVTTTAGALATTIANGVVTYAKLQNVSTSSRVLARASAGAGVVEECTVSQVLDFLGSVARGDIVYRGASGWARLAAGTSGQALTTQGAGADPVWSQGVPAGAIVPVAALATPGGHLECDGSAVSRATYAVLFAALSSTQSGSRTSGSAVVTGLPSTAALRPGFQVTGSGIPAGATIASVDSGTQVTLSANATATVVGDLVFTAWGAGDGTTTFNLPDLRGRGPVGAGQGGSLTNRTLGQKGGAETHTLVTAEIPSHFHTTGSPYDAWVGFSSTSGGTHNWNISGGGNNMAGLPNTTTSTGGGGAHNNMPPFAVVRWVIKT